jgi:hypothetical protein
MLTFGLTCFLFQQALEVLRKTPNSVLLTVCRPASDVFCIQGPSEPPPPPPPPRRDPAHSITCSSHYTLSLPAPQTEGPSGVSVSHRALRCVSNQTTCTCGSAMTAGAVQYLSSL